MKKLHIICPNVEPGILRNHHLASSVSKIHRDNTLDALFLPESLDSPLLKKYCSENKTAPIELVVLENIYRDIATTHFGQINSYLNSRNPKNDIAFVPLVNENTGFLKNLFEKLGLETEILDPIEKYSFSNYV